MATAYGSAAAAYKAATTAGVGVVEFGVLTLRLPGIGGDVDDVEVVDEAERSEDVDGGPLLLPLLLLLLLPVVVVAVCCCCCCCINDDAGCCCCCCWAASRLVRADVVAAVWCESLSPPKFVPDPDPDPDVVVVE